MDLIKEKIVWFVSSREDGVLNTHRMIGEMVKNFLDEVNCTP